MPHPTVQMGKKKNPLKRVLSKLKNIHMSPPENGPLLPQKVQHTENPCLKRMKESLRFEVSIPNYVKLRNKVNLDCEPQENCKSKEHLQSLISKEEYHNACLFIHDVEQNEKCNGSELYEVLAEEMWKCVTQALDGDSSQTVALQSISQCIQWAKQQHCSKGPDWSPQMWLHDIKTLFEYDIKKHNEKLELERGLDQYLEDLEKNLSETILRLEHFPEVLTAAYLKCLHVELFQQLTSLVDKKLKYEDHVLLFKWAHKEHRRLCKCRVGSEDFDHMLLGNWFLNSGDRIASTGRDAMYRTLVEILQSEIVWHSYPGGEVRYYFTDVLQEGTRICKAVEDLGDTLVSKLQSLFWEEFLHFVTRYKTFLTEKLSGSSSENGICVGIRIVKNCSILRNTMNNFDLAPRDPEIQRIQTLLGDCENQGIELVLINLKPSLKEAFQNYFKKSCNEYEIVLRHLKRTLIKEDIQNDQKMVTLIHHRLVVLFIQSFFKCSKKLSRQNSGEIFSNGRKKLLDFFSDMVLDDYLLPSDPLDFISEMLTANDHTSLHTTTVFFIDKHQDLREEHLSAILTIKGNLSTKEKEDLLYYIRNRQTDRHRNKLCFFEDCMRELHTLSYYVLSASPVNRLRNVRAPHP
ncbi:uncharacterized protein ACNLHF_004063 [Anomaloglossus baeobatrachus]|uniref:uncharacterized protein LOC142258546 n=1 Tax=Anomaloglossus baeobatrachus TaxID=238106 RepID=UPI003F504A5F